MQFAPATKKKSRLRLAILGPSGSGKTYSALAIGKHLAAMMKSPLAVIDTERGSASKYAGDVADFSVLELTSFSPGNYIKAIRLAQANGFKVIVVDSLSHAWFGADGILDQKDKKGDTSFGAWRTLTPQHNDLVEAILAFDGHIICTMRSKMEYVQEKDSKGKTTVRKVGLAPVQREGMEYEFDVIGEMDVDNCMHVTKTRCSALADASIRKPGADVAATLLAWLDQGVDEAPRPTAPTAVNAPSVGTANRTTQTAARAQPGTQQSASGSSTAGSAAATSTTSETAPSSTTVASRVTAEFDMDRVYKLAELICAAESDADLAYALGEVPKVVDESKTGVAVARSLDGLLEQRAAQLRDEDWVATEQQRRDVERLRTALTKRDIAKKQADQAQAAE